jgi:histidinol dehydrogenase
MAWFYSSTVASAGDILPLKDVFQARRAGQRASVDETVSSIIAAVRANGDEALVSLTQQFDCPELTAIRVPDEAIEAARSRIAGTPLEAALLAARDRITRFHQAHRRYSWLDDSVPGERLGQRIIPFSCVGIYVPGGRAAYPSTVLMTAVPARVAGVGRILMCTPPQAETGLPPDGTLAAAHIAGVDEVYAIGGAQAIAAMAYGTATVPQVDKIVGPGNAYVNAAKRMVYGDVGIDMLAGPSEVAVVVDESADIAGAARELIAQTEHDPMNAALLVAATPTLLEQINVELDKQLATLPRASIVRASVSEQSVAVVCGDRDLMIAIVDAFAPEHLHLDVVNAWELAHTVRNAGAILVGKHTSAAHGDYIAGPSHTLPTAGAARFSSPLNVDDFTKKSSVLWLDEAVSRQLAPLAEAIATYEGLEGHARSARGDAGGETI